MIRRYEYSAELVANPPVPLSVEGGTVALDVSRAPHVTATITVVRPSSSILNRLDPRQSPAPRVRVYVRSSGTLVRTFDLVVRDLDATQGRDQLTITAMSDESLAEDYSPLVPQTGIYQLSNSVRRVTDWILAQVPGIRKNYCTYIPRIGAGGAGEGSSPEPSAFTSPWTISAGGGTWDVNYEHMRINDPRLPKPSMSAMQALCQTPPTGTLFLSTGMFPVPAGEVTGSLYGANNFTGGPTFQLKITFYDDNGVTKGDAYGPTASQEAVNNRWQVTGTRPDGATQARLSLALRSGTVTAGKVAWITGACVESGPTMGPYMDSVLQYDTTDADCRAFWPAVNLLTNPSFENGQITDGWEVHANATNLRTVTNTTPPSTVGQLEGNDCLYWEAAGSGTSYVKTKIVAVEGGKWYAFGASYAFPVGRSIITILRFLSASGATLANYQRQYSTPANQWFSTSEFGQAPPGTVSAIVFIGIVGATAGQAGKLDCCHLFEVEDGGLSNASAGLGFFTGDTPDTAEYSYSWSGTPHASTSIRTPVNERRWELLVWEPGVSALGFLAPLLQSLGLRLVCDGERLWTLRDESYQAPGTATVRYGVNMIAGSDRLERGEWFDAAVTRYRWRNAYGEEVSKVDAYGSSRATKSKLYEKDSPYPGKGFSEYAVRRAKQRGRYVSVTAVADWSVVAEQGVSIGLEALTPQIGVSDRIEFNLDSDEMTITTRTTDTRTGSIDALTGTINALTGTINQL